MAIEAKNPEAIALMYYYTAYSCMKQQKKDVSELDIRNVLGIALLEIIVSKLKIYCNYGKFWLSCEA